MKQGHPHLYPFLISTPDLPLNSTQDYPERGASSLSFLSSLVHTEALLVFTFYIVNHKMATLQPKGKNWKEGKKKKKEGKRRQESNLCDCEQNVLQLCGGLGGVANSQNLWLFNFSTAMVQVRPRCVGMKIKKKKKNSLLFIEVIIKIPMYSF